MTCCAEMHDLPARRMNSGCVPTDDVYCQQLLVESLCLANLARHRKIQRSDRTDRARATQRAYPPVASRDSRLQVLFPRCIALAKRLLHSHTSTPTRILHIIPKQSVCAHNCGTVITIEETVNRLAFNAIYNAFQTMIEQSKVLLRSR